ncbi:hypothetical protein LNTAR_12947 [Lentisphaera araneosa HTCC2155]|jgi:hypothetical protein|uniref:Uncharacterized protein n=1 Tax=Lentisphaera araneosa HTCC2155 TaxID=313628 RepID=A6DUH3_9BACT|nr:hypothetical protein [Lentisphaera araneosa]EDM24708.1 hypothetical protein LNTAR_12947 [Lentisphaera araneosa HTCC2155]
MNYIEILNTYKNSADIIQKVKLMEDNNFEKWLIRNEVLKFINSDKNELKDMSKKDMIKRIEDIYKAMDEL